MKKKYVIADMWIMVKRSLLKTILFLYGVSIFVLTIGMLSDPNDFYSGITRVLIIVYFSGFLLFYRLKLKDKNFRIGALKFIFLTWFSAMTVETFFMISGPVDDAFLIIPGETPVGDMVRYTLTDFVFTTPVYVTVALLFCWLNPTSVQSQRACGGSCLCLLEV